MTHLDRRTFLATGAAVAGMGITRRGATAFPQADAVSLPVIISSAGRTGPVERAMEELARGARPVDAVVAGVTLYEDDPSVTSVGYGGLPNEDGVVQLDASVMDGPSHKAGAVAAIENIRNPAKVALEVMRRTDHVLLVGDGARRFAVAHGFEEQDMLTPKAREAWLRWKRNLNPKDDRLDDDQIVAPPVDAPVGAAEIPHTHGTIHCAAVDQGGNVGACTTTSGLSYKIPGRVGDSPIIGAGMFVDNEIGAAGATGRGEALLQSCGSFQIVEHMGRGDDPTEACLKVLRWISAHTLRPMLLRPERLEPNFGATLYAVRKDGAYGSASMRRGPHFTVHDRAGARKEPCAWLYE